MRYPAVLYGPDDRVVRPVAQHGPPERPGLTRASRRSLTRRSDLGLSRGFQSLLAALPDEIIVQEGPEIYDRMRADDAVFPAEFQLMSRVLARPWDVRPAKHLCMICMTACCV